MDILGISQTVSSEFKPQPLFPDYPTDPFRHILAPSYPVAPICHPCYTQVVLVVFTAYQTNNCDLIFARKQHINVRTLIMRREGKGYCLVANQ